MSDSRFPVTAVATGVGSLPGVDSKEAAAVIAGELPEFAHLAELPARGPWADITGRACSLLVELPVQLSVNRWQLTGGPGRDLVRARSLLGQDLDTHEEALQDFAGVFKVQVCGPLTLAATVETRNGERVLADPGALRDVTASLAEGIATHLGEVRARIPHASAVVVQIDEPAAAAVIAGSVPTASGYRTIPAMSTVQANDLVGLVTRSVQSAAGVPAIHLCCDVDVLAGLVDLDGNSVGVSCPVEQVAERPLLVDAFGGFFDAGGVWLAGLDMSDPAGSLASMLTFMHSCGVDAQRAAAHTVLTPDCGLASVTVPEAVKTYTALRGLARDLGHDDLRELPRDRELT
ncbi:MAG TPA: methionine synthase [Actinomycetes bacterium]|nr:methionine synthase [Actinomycetes bacterium]